MNLAPMELSQCPSCGRIDRVGAKLHTFDLAGESYFLEDYEVADPARYEASPHTWGSFVHALFCSRCEVGFIPEDRLEDLGIALCRTRGRFGRTRPYGIGRMSRS